MSRPAGYRHTASTKIKIGLSHKAEKSVQWRGNKAAYSTIHAWLLRHYGKADHCISETCIGKSKLYEWALIKGRAHDHKIENYQPMCKSCHRIYDGINRKKH